MYSDCCSDIQAIGCHTAEGSCVKANFSGCCTSDQVSCRGTGGTTSCYCDVLCYSVGDCCSDIGEIGCQNNSAALQRELLAVILL